MGSCCNVSDRDLPVFIPRLIELYKNGLFPFDKLIKFYELENINQAVADSESGVTLKAVIRMPQ
jgi:aryl-alcohol dehydrogenase